MKLNHQKLLQLGNQKFYSVKLRGAVLVRLLMLSHTVPPQPLHRVLVYSDLWLVIIFSVVLGIFFAQLMSLPYLCGALILQRLENSMGFRLNWMKIMVLLGFFPSQIKQLEFHGNYHINRFSLSFVIFFVFDCFSPELYLCLQWFWKEWKAKWIRRLAKDLLKFWHLLPWKCSYSCRMLNHRFKKMCM